MPWSVFFTSRPMAVFIVMTILFSMGGKESDLSSTGEILSRLLRSNTQCTDKTEEERRVATLVLTFVGITLFSETRCYISRSKGGRFFAFDKDNEWLSPISFYSTPPNANQKSADREQPHSKPGGMVGPQAERVQKVLDYLASLVHMMIAEDGKMCLGIFKDQIETVDERNAEKKDDRVLRDIVKTEDQKAFIFSFFKFFLLGKMWEKMKKKSAPGMPEQSPCIMEEIASKKNIKKVEALSWPLFRNYLSQIMTWTFGEELSKMPEAQPVILDLIGFDGYQPATYSAENKYRIIQKLLEDLKLVPYHYAAANEIYFYSSEVYSGLEKHGSIDPYQGYMEPLTRVKRIVCQHRPKDTYTAVFYLSGSTALPSDFLRTVKVKLLMEIMREYGVQNFAVQFDDAIYPLKRCAERRSVATAREEYIVDFLERLISTKIIRRCRHFWSIWVKNPSKSHLEALLTIARAFDIGLLELEIDDDYEKLEHVYPFIFRFRMLKVELDIRLVKKGSIFSELGKQRLAARWKMQSYTRNLILKISDSHVFTGNTCESLRKIARVLRRYSGVIKELYDVRVSCHGKRIWLGCFSFLTIAFKDQPGQGVMDTILSVWNETTRKSVTERSVSAKNLGKKENDKLIACFRQLIKYDFSRISMETDDSGLFCLKFIAKSATGHVRVPFQRKQVVALSKTKSEGEMKDQLA